MSEQEDVDPFAPEHVGTIQFITTARVYDVLMGIYSELAPEKAAALMEIHSQGALATPTPYFNGIFIADEINAEDTEE